MKISDGFAQYLFAIEYSSHFMEREVFNPLNPVLNTDRERERRN